MFKSGRIFTAAKKQKTEKDKLEKLRQNLINFNDQGDFVPLLLQPLNDNYQVEDDQIEVKVNVSKRRKNKKTN